MFGTNPIARKKDYEKLAANQLMVTSMFFTIQGEGPFAGHPAIFIRLTGCQLQCKMCDTYFIDGDSMTFDQIYERLVPLQKEFYAKHNLPAVIDPNILIVITGGEPLLQNNLTNFFEYIKYLDGNGNDRLVQIESNGLVYQDIPYHVTLVVSPKANDKTGKMYKVNEKLLKRADYLKFVISADQPGYQDVPDWAINHSKEYSTPIYVSPMAIYARQPTKSGTQAEMKVRSEVDERISFWTPGLFDVKVMQRNYEHAAFIAMKHQVRLGVQIHLFANLP